jgi:hypothetical protein
MEKPVSTLLGIALLRDYGAMIVGEVVEGPPNPIITLKNPLSLHSEHGSPPYLKSDILAPDLLDYATGDLLLSFAVNEASLWMYASAEAGHGFISLYEAAMRDLRFPEKA